MDFLMPYRENHFGGERLRGIRPVDVVLSVCRILLRL